MGQFSIRKACSVAGHKLSWYDVYLEILSDYEISVFIKLNIPMNSIIILIAIGILFLINRLSFARKRKQRRDYYRKVYLKSDEWKRKRYVVLKRDNWTCIHCGSRATQVHHMKYAKHQIGKEPIKWLVSVCKSCHESLHS